jgi:hypothetical protein
MIVYTYDYGTGAYLGIQELGIADIDPRSRAWMIPGNATVEPPPRCDQNCIPIWRGGRWEVFECVAEIPDAQIAQWRERIHDIYATTDRVKP